MKIVHIIVCEDAAKKLDETLKQEHDAVPFEILTLRDMLNFGTLKTENLTFSEGRTAFWESLNPANRIWGAIDDLEILMKYSTRLSNNEDFKIWFWMAGNAADLCAYYWLIHFLKKHQGKVSVVNISGLPFIDDIGKLFYASDIIDLPQKEIIKAKKLARVIIPSEWEMDAEEWKNLLSQNEGVRIIKAGKSIQSMPIDYFDEDLKAATLIESMKANKVIQNTIQQHKIKNGASFFRWRLSLLSSE